MMSVQHWVLQCTHVCTAFEQRKLFYQARMFKMKNDYKHVWTANHRIYLRLTQDSPQIPIKSIEDLNALENK